MTKQWNDGMCWVEGLRINARGDECWAPLYCSKKASQAKALLVKLLNGVNDFEDFRVVRPEEQMPFAERSAMVACYSEGLRSIPACPSCASLECSKIKRGSERLWKCLSCNRRWPREGAVVPLRRANRAKTERVEAISASLHKTKIPVEPPTGPLEPCKPSGRTRTRSSKS